MKLSQNKQVNRSTNGENRKYIGRVLMTLLIRCRGEGDCLKACLTCIRHRSTDDELSLSRYHLPLSVKKLQPQMIVY